MRQPALLEPVAHHQPGLAAADDQRLDLFNRHGAEPCLALAGPYPCRRSGRCARMIQRRNAAKSRCSVLEAAIDQIPAHALGHAQRKRRDQPSGGEIVVDIGADAHRDAEAVDGGLQRLAVKLKLRSARRDACDAGGLQPRRPVLGRMRDAQQARSFQIAGALQLRRQPRRAHRQQIGGEQRFGDQARPFAVAELDAAAPVVAERRRGAAGGDAHVDVGLLLAEIRQPRDQPSHRKGRTDADGQHPDARSAR